MIECLWDQSPIIQRMKAASKGEGKIETLQHAVVTVVKARFSFLTELAQQRVRQINDCEKLDDLLIQISAAPDETSVSLLLVPTVA